MKYLKTLVGAALLTLGVASTSHASTVTTTTLDFESTDFGAYVLGTDQASGNISIVNGNCAAGSCLNLRASAGGETVTLERSDGGEFSVKQFWFQLLGVALPNTLRIASSKGASIDYPATTYPNNNGGQTIVLGMDFADITSMTFTNVNRGGIRIDDIVVETTYIPLPAAGWLLIAGFGALGIARRRKS